MSRPEQASTAVEAEVSGARADIVLRRPEVLNAMSWQSFGDLAVAAARVAAEPDVRVVVVRGDGRAFCSGIDTTTFGSAGGVPEDLVAHAQAGFRALASIPVPTIAAVQGYAYGAGAQLALVCDLRVMARDAKFGLLEGRYGLVPDLGGTHRLPALAGPGRAKKMMWLAEAIDGDEAGRAGIAEVVVNEAELTGVVDDLADRIAAAPPIAVRAAKRLVDAASTSTFEQAMDNVAIAQKEILQSADFVEAIAAFVEKRTPRFTGR